MRQFHFLSSSSRSSGACVSSFSSSQLATLVWIVTGAQAASIGLWPIGHPVQAIGLSARSIRSDDYIDAGAHITVSRNAI
jgi:hypothetical protein